jgi:hypothetical protein
MFALLAETLIHDYYNHGKTILRVSDRYERLVTVAVKVSALLKKFITGFSSG